MYSLTCLYSPWTSVFCATRCFLTTHHASTESPTDIFQFGIFQLDLKARELHKAGVKVATLRRCTCVRMTPAP
jgi:hypothetical protein